MFDPTPDSVLGTGQPCHNSGKEAGSRNNFISWCTNEVYGVKVSGLFAREPYQTSLGCLLLTRFVLWIDQQQE
jgi:hypothetical protein